jgi:predicted GNAT family acetyltransferase
VDGHTAYSVYRIEGDVITFIHTIVPPALEGRGVGSRLVAGELAIVRERGLKVIPQCPFVRAWMEKHPETRDLLAPDPA